MSFFRVAFRFMYARKSSELVIDPTVFKECENREVKVWSWRLLRTRKFIVHLKGGTLTI